ncbi:MAG TPA: glycosyltransferase family 2 protein [Lacunisphaera sp.]|nr:glycosyltransferase family 2 protein [Lacunisphaera sp.]
MQASFVIPLHNCLALTQECLRTLVATLPSRLDAEIVLVDDASTDGTAAWLRELTAAPARGPAVVTLRNETNAGFGVTCNRGAAVARGDLLFFLNSDLVLTLGWFEPMRDTLARHPEAGLVGNVQLVAATGEVDHTGIAFNHQGKPVHEQHASRAERRAGLRSVPALTGACFALHRSTWRELGGFDEAYVNGAEDVDLCLRALAAGRKNYVALRSVVRHHVSQSPGRKRHDEQNSRRLMERWRQALAPLAARAWCRNYLAREWSGPRDPGDFPRATRALLLAGGLQRRPPPAILDGVEHAIESEAARWRRLLDGAPAEPDAGPMVI